MMMQRTNARRHRVHFNAGKQVIVLMHVVSKLADYFVTETSLLAGNPLVLEWT